MIILVLTPIDSQLVDLFQRVKDPDGTLSLYRNITTEGYSDGTYEKLLQNDHIVPDDSHNLLGLAICAYKNGNLQSSQLLIEKALKLTPFDPVILVTAGNIYFQKDLIEKSMQVLTTASTQTHRDVSSVFNLSQCYLKQMETVKGTEVMDKAAKEDQFTVNAFVQKNDTYYSKNWPALRCTMIPDYTPFYFWKHLFFETNQNWKSTTQSWGTSFLGINPIHSFLLFIIFFLTILITPFFYPTRRIKKLFECKSCGRTICRKCSEGILCATCNNHTSFVKSDKKQDEIHAGIIYKFELFRTIKQCSLDMLFPGIGSFLFSKRSLRNSTILVFISSCIFATYTTLYHLYNQSGMTIEISLVLTALLLYNAFFIYNRIKDLLAFLKSHSRTN